MGRILSFMFGREIREGLFSLLNNNRYYNTAQKRRLACKECGQ